MRQKRHRIGHIVDTRRLRLCGGISRGDLLRRVDVSARIGGRKERIGRLHRVGARVSWHEELVWPEEDAKCARQLRDVIADEGERVLLEPRTRARLERELAVRALDATQIAQVEARQLRRRR